MNFHEAAEFFETDKGPRRPTTRNVCGPQTGGPPMSGHGYTLAYEREFPEAFARTSAFPPGKIVTPQGNGDPDTLLEIGVQMGCSLRLWDWWFSERATTGGVFVHVPWKIVGLELCLVPGLKKALDATLKRPERVFLVEGSSTDPEVAKKVKTNHGPLFDIVIDDGSHWPEDQVKTFQNFWPLVKPGGIYCLEDLHQSWWPEEVRRGSIMPVLTQLVEDCLGRGKYAEWSGIPLEDPVPTYAEEQFFSVRMYRNMVVFERRVPA